MPSEAELEAFLALDPTPRRPGEHPRLRQLHRRAARPHRTGDVPVLAIDHRWQLQEMCDEAGVPWTRIGPLKALLFAAFEQVAADRSDVGILIDDVYGSALLERMTGRGHWLARAIDVPKSRPVEFMCGDDVGITLRSWPSDQIAKLMVYAHPDDPTEVADAQFARMLQIARAAAAADRSFLIEFQPPAGVAAGPGYLSRMMAAAYARDITPDWWKLPPIGDPAEWSAAAAVIAEADPTCEGMLVLGQTADPETLSAALAAAAAEPMVRGFAIGRAIFGPAARLWLRGGLTDEALVAAVVERFTSTIQTWEANRR